MCGRYARKSKPGIIRLDATSYVRSDDGSSRVGDGD